MARGKKNESALTPEGKLAQALVPAWEQPYKVPKNWFWSYIRSGYEVTSSKRVHKDDWISEGIPFYRTRELVKLSDQGYVDNELFISEEQYEKYKSAYGVPKINDLLISGVGTIGVPYIVDSEEKFYFKDGNIIWFKNKGFFLPKYIYYLYKSLFMDNQIHEMSSGTTVDTYTIINANNTMVPVPPIAEQQRIVDRIEYLFSKLDEAKERAQSVLDGFETRKAAILHKAFTGELTAKWRANKNLSANNQFNDTDEYPYTIPNGWNAVILGELVQIRRGASPRPIKAFITDSVDGINWIKIGDADGGKYITAIKEKVTPSGAQKSVYVEKGTLLLSNSMSFGHPYILEVDGCIHDGWLAILPSVYFDKEFLYYALLFSNWYFEQVAVGTAVRNLNSERVAGTPLPICSIEEQKEIVRILDNLYSKEQRAKEAAEAVLEQIDLLKKSILARAFRGELGTNDPNEESAVELLKEVIC